jgi:hypothetical protein
MKKMTIIIGLCSMGNTENVGLFTTPNEDEFDTFFKEMFGEDVKTIDGEPVCLKPNHDCIYSYNSLIGGYLEDELFIVDNEEIYVYEIDD